MKGSIVLNHVPWIEVDVVVDEGSPLRCELTDESKEMIAKAVKFMAEEIYEAVAEAKEAAAETFCIHVYPNDDITNTESSSSEFKRIH